MAERGLSNVLFHGVGTPNRSLEPGEDRVWITVDDFHRVLDEIASWPNASISFDDGNSSDIEIGLEALKQRGLTAKFFILAGRLGQRGSLTETEVKELHRSGMTIGTHGMHHSPWRRVRDADRRAEFVDARDAISAVVGAAVLEAAAPFGDYDRRVISDLRVLGYSALHTSDGRMAKAGAWLQPRFSIRKGDTPESLRAEIMAAQRQPRRTALAAKAIAKRLR